MTSSIVPRRRFDLISTFVFLLFLGSSVGYIEYKAAHTNTYLQDWLVLTGIPSELSMEEMLEVDLLSTFGGEGKFTPKIGMRYPIPGKDSITWRRYTSPTKEIVFLNCNDNPDHRATNVVGYAFTTMRSDRDRKAWLLLTADDGVRVWHNGLEIYKNPQPGSFKLDSIKVPISLKGGENTFFVKVTQGTGGWGFAAHIALD